MSRNLWFISDTHFFHANMLKFVDEAGKRVRSEFSSVEEMNETIVERWNEVVRPEDKVYHLGDVTFRYDRPASELLHRLNGHKRLILGNHDKLNRGQDILTRAFETIKLWRIFKEHNFTCTHIPMRLDSQRKTQYNVHGHLHQQLMSEPEYISVCVEHTGYRPVHLDEIKKIISDRNL